MFKKLSLATAAAAATLAAVPAVADARPRGTAYGYYENSAHARGYDRGRYYRGDRYDRYDDYDDRRYARRGYDDRRYYRDRNHNRRCSGTTGTIVGGALGALLGREVTRDRYRGRSGTTGTIVGGAAGALAGRAIDKSRC